MPARQAGMKAGRQARTYLPDRQACQTRKQAGMQEERQIFFSVELKIFSGRKAHACQPGRQA